MRVLFATLSLPALCLLHACNDRTADTKVLGQMDLKRGTIISCGPPGQEFGAVSFNMSCDGKVKDDFNLGMEMLHSFEYDESEKMFAKVIDESPKCAMGYWGVAMSNFHPLWSPPTEAELKKGSQAIAIAKTIGDKTPREAAYIAAIETFYKNWQTSDHAVRTVAFAKAMEELHRTYPDDKEAAVFYALALVASARPTDKTYSNQHAAGEILNSLYPGQPDHPGIVHYIIHTYDYPGLATKALSAARKYAAVAPSSAHAQHMPSHIFTRLGLWEECIRSNQVAATAARCYAESAGIKGHWDEELHALDYLIYGYLQRGDNDSAKLQLDYLSTIKEIHPANFKVSYAFASMPSRYYLENKDWHGAAALEMPATNIEWNNFPWQQAIIHFTRTMGAIQLGNTEEAKKEFVKLKGRYDTLMQLKDGYKARQVKVQMNACEGWMAMKAGKSQQAMELMTQAANMEDSTEKLAVSPGEVVPARELLGDMLMAMNKPAEALAAYEQVLTRSPNRFNSLYGAGLAASKAGEKEKALAHYRKLEEISKGVNSSRPELTEVRRFIARK